jgi:hypothetical protein
MGDFMGEGWLARLFDRHKCLIFLGAAGQD